MMLLDPKATFWERTKIPPALDLRRLLPPAFPKQMRFESIEDASVRSFEREKRLKATEYDYFAPFLEDCRNGFSPCRLPICPICARRFRRWLAANNLALADKLTDPMTVTLFCEFAREGQLEAVSIPKIHDRVRHSFRRAGLANAVAIGGTEAGFRVVHEDWVVHLHLLIGNVDKAGLQRLRAAWAKTGVPGAMRVSQINDRARQIGYLQKFSTFHRPGEQSSWRRARAYPLPKPQFEELTGWLTRYDFPEFIFMLGVRRRGNRIRLLEKKQ